MLNFWKSLCDKYSSSNLYLKFTSKLYVLFDTFLKPYVWRAKFYTTLKVVILLIVATLSFVSINLSNQTIKASPKLAELCRFINVDETYSIFIIVVSVLILLVCLIVLSAYLSCLSYKKLSILVNFLIALVSCIFMRGNYIIVYIKSLHFTGYVDGSFTDVVLSNPFFTIYQKVEARITLDSAMLHWIKSDKDLYNLISGNSVIKDTLYYKLINQQYIEANDYVKELTSNLNTKPDIVNYWNSCFDWVVAHPYVTVTGVIVGSFVCYYVFSCVYNFSSGNSKDTKLYSMFYELNSDFYKLKSEVIGLKMEVDDNLDRTTEYLNGAVAAKFEGLDSINKITAEVIPVLVNSTEQTKVILAECVKVVKEVEAKTEGIYVYEKDFFEIKAWYNLVKHAIKEL